MELEDFPWLFADTYEDTTDAILPEKIHIFEKSVLNPQLQHIFWWSQEAINRFNIFCEQYQLRKEVIDRVTTISSVIYPVSEVVERTIPNTEYNRFMAVFNEKNFYRKGGDVILSVFNQLEKDRINNWNLTVVGSLPKNITQSIPSNINLLPQTNPTLPLANTPIPELPKSGNGAVTASIIFGGGIIFLLGIGTLSIKNFKTGF